MNDSTNYRSYVLTWAVAVLLCGLPLAANALLLWRSSELESFADLATELQGETFVYGSALNGNDLKFKVELYRVRQTPLVAIGSSRMMQFREEAFQLSPAFLSKAAPVSDGRVNIFTNCGGVFSSLEHGEAFVNELLQMDHLPEVALLGVDYWWFHPHYQAPPSQVLHTNTRESVLTRQKLLAPFAWLQDGRLSAGQFANIVFTGRLANPTASFTTKGIQALRTASGWRADGSYLNARAAFLTPEDHTAMRAEVQAIRRGEVERPNLGRGDFVSDGAYLRFQGIVERLRERGVTVVLMLPAIMPAYLDAARANAAAPEFAGQAAFIQALRNRLQRTAREQQIEFYDFTDLGASNCEYLDGWHPGEIANLRALRQIHAAGSPALADWIDRPRIDQAIASGTDNPLWIQAREQGQYRPSSQCIRF